MKNKEKTLLHSKSNVNLRNVRLGFYVIICFAYIILKMYRNSLDSSGGVGGIWNIVNILFVIVGFLSLLFIYNNRKTVPKCIKIGILYSAVATFAAFLNLQSFSIHTVFNFLTISYFVPVIIVFYRYGLRVISDRCKLLITVLFYIVAVFTIYLMTRRSVHGVLDVYQSDAYFLVCLFPFVLLWQKGLRLYIPMGLVSIVLLFAGKRNGAIAFVAALLFYLIIEYKIGNVSKRFIKTVIRLAAISTFLFLIYSFVDKRYNINLIDRLFNISIDGGSGRDVIYSYIWSSIKDSSLFRWMFGYGVNGVTTVLGRTSSAHNDFLEITFNYGFPSAICFVAFYISMIFICFKMTKEKFYGASAFASSVIISVFMSMFSNYASTFTHITGMACFWGIVLAEWTLTKKRANYFFNKKMELI